jgi:hypothetical protein
VVPDNHAYTRWKLDLIARLATTCPYCGAAPCRPCRTLRGRIPGRITPGPCHDDRYRAAAARGDAPAKPAPADPPPPYTTAYAGYGSDEPYADAEELRSWLRCLVVGLVECAACGADSCEPCRTLKGRVPGRITTPHRPRWEAAGRAGISQNFGTADAQALIREARARQHAPGCTTPP